MFLLTENHHLAAVDLDQIANSSGQPMDSLFYGIIQYIFCIAKGSPFTLGVGGQGCDRQKLRFWLQVSAQTFAWSPQASPHSRMHLERYRKCVKLIGFPAVVV